MINISIPWSISSVSESSSIFFPIPTLESTGAVILNIFLISKFLLVKTMGLSTEKNTNNILYLISGDLLMP